MRQQQTLWESSGRPLFIKSVWIQSADGFYRHFILDYDNQKKANDVVNKTRKVLRPTVSCDLSETEYLSLQLIGSSKSCKPAEYSRTTNRRRSQTISPANKTFLELLKRKGSGCRDEQTPSKRNSLQDISHHESTACDEKLAERVLNWLDLAGKTTIIKPNFTSPNPPALKKPATNQRSKSLTRPATAVIKRPDSVKHITIIFNKEGIPVRYNRPVRFTDLFRSGYSASRKIASNMASRNARMAAGIGPKRIQVPGSAAFDRASMDLNKTKGQEMPGSKQAIFEGDYRTMINKQILENSCNYHEARKQLHIFMPSLPKKTLTATDCESSCLSTGFSDYCKIAN